MSKIIQSNEQNFSKDVLEAGKLVLIYFWAEWCGPCKAMGPIIEKLADKEEKIQVVKIDVDKNQSVAGKYNIMSIPTLLVFKKGMVVNQSSGLTTLEQLEGLVSKHS